MAVDFPRLRQTLEKNIRARTGNYVKNLDVKVSDESVVLKGKAPTFYVKQLAQESIRNVTPVGFAVDNNITVN